RKRNALRAIRMPAMRCAYGAGTNRPRSPAWRRRAWSIFARMSSRRFFDPLGQSDEGKQVREPSRAEPRRALLQGFLPMQYNFDVVRRNKQPCATAGEA